MVAARSLSNPPCNAKLPRAPSSPTKHRVRRPPRPNVPPTLDGSRFSGSFATRQRGGGTICRCVAMHIIAHMLQFVDGVRGRDSSNDGSANGQSNRWVIVELLSLIWCALSLARGFQWLFLGRWIGRFWIFGHSCAIAWGANLWGGF